MNGRFYDPLIGRMLSADVVVQFPGNLQSYNRYSYVQNNPLSLIDPTGFAAAVAMPIGEAAAALAEGTEAAGPLGAVVVLGGVQIYAASHGYQSTPMYQFPLGLGIDGINRMQEAERLKQLQAAASHQATAEANAQSTTPKPKVDDAKPKETSSGGQMDPKNSPGKEPNKNKDDKPSSKELRKNMEDAGRPVGDDEAAHHIVAGTDKRAAESRELLKESKIPINSETNGAALPKNTASPNPDNKTVHSTMHTDEYHDNVTETLRNTAPEDRAAALKAIAEELEKKKKQ